MTLLPRAILGANDDWIESFRRTYFPPLNHTLHRIGHVIGVPLYSTGVDGGNQYVGAMSEDEDTIEQELVEVGAVRNPLACFKHLNDGRESEGSWVILHGDRPDLIEHGRQLHITLFERKDGKPGRAIYAHYEDDWRVHPLWHLRCKHFSPKTGVAKTKKLIHKSSFLTLA